MSGRLGRRLDRLQGAWPEHPPPAPVSLDLARLTADERAELAELAAACRAAAGVPAAEVGAGWEPDGLWALATPQLRRLHELQGLALGVPAGQGTGVRR